MKKNGHTCLSLDSNNMLYAILSNQKLRVFDPQLDPEHEMLEKPKYVTFK